MKRNQRGHAGVLFVLILPVLWGITAVSLDGSRGIQTKVRLDEAVDSSVIAVSAADEHVLTSDKALVENYVRSYVNDAVTVAPFVDVSSCGDEGSCVQYDVAANVKIDSWFPGGSTIQGFDESMLVASYAKAQKGTVIASDPIDVVVAMDMSLSMQQPFTGEPGKKRLDATYEVIDKVVSVLGNAVDGDKKSTLAFVPWGTGYYDEGCLKHEPVYNEKGFNHESHTWDHPATIAKLWQTKDRTHCIKQSWLQMPRMNGILYPTPDFNNFSTKVRAMTFDQGTQIGHGIIKGAQLLRQGSNKKRVLIAVTDGQDSQYSDLLKSINEYGLCKEITRGLSANNAGELFDFTFIFIGLDAHLYPTDWMADCVGEENVYTAETGKEFLDAMLSFTTATESDVGQFVK
ncbi:TPA: hypothetical protein ACGUPU_002814 [Vibrio vulnificus]